ncbi:hypothetical protein D0Z07_2721 [Hyphodiscus hymeniophilus]|uniref:PWWP domain-containing protein n=1 Tax=Hyphodiscus hymeniophilus TaxID=353542 RepID=A0A9P6VMY2_9HELO|nr:hypothetical protein D0Z07_2721 [Hyphodiscus hymeniophilus]
MAEEPTSQEAVLPVPVETRLEISEPIPAIEKTESAVEDTTVVDPVDPSKEVAPAPKEDIEQPVPPVSTKVEAEAIIENSAEPKITNDKQPVPEQLSAIEDKPASTLQDTEMTSDTKADEAVTIITPDGDAAVSTEASGSKSNPRPRRKSGGVPEHKNKKLNKKASKAKMTHTDAKPGDYFMIRLKGYPLWPGIVCDESMLPNTLLKSRPVTATRPDGSYREDYADGGAKVNDRTFPVMYLHTNEFSWIPNTDLVDMDIETVGNVTSSMRKDLAGAHLLAAEQHDLDYFKDILKNFMEQRAADLEAKEAAKAAKKAEKAAKAEKASKPKRKSKAAVEEDEDADGDVDMADAPADLELEDVETGHSEKKNKKKRKATDDGEDTPKTDSVKKPKTTIKLNTTPKPKANGESTPKSVKDSTAKVPKPKTKKAAPKVEESPEPIVPPKEPELTPEEKRQKKEAYQAPKEDEMKQMSEFVNKLEGYADLEVSIIRATKINKVLKAILKVQTIPLEEEFRFKPRSQSLLDKWNKLLASEGTPADTTAPTNGVKEEVKPDVEDAKAIPTTANGSKESTEEKVEENTTTAEESITESKEGASAPKVEEEPVPNVTEPVSESKPEPAIVESTA